ncbi:MAG: M15 family metallopeptidase [Thermosynechococcaceae cyanobacterium]
MAKKPYWDIPIVECNEPLVAIAPEEFVCANPHPYVALGAPYGDESPFFVRQGVLRALQAAQTLLQQEHPAWRLFIFDAYRPVAVQQFMVDYTFAAVLQERGLARSQLSETETTCLWEEVYQLWAPPILDRHTPPPHSTGAAVDITLFDTQTQETVFMGSPIDEFSARSQPDYFGTLAANATLEEGDRALAALAHHHRQLLCHVMDQAGFQRHPGEWWHFCLGDQMWAWLVSQDQSGEARYARYGRLT